MKLRLAQTEPEDDQIDITPMIDCIFLLVLFFMVTSSFIEEAKVFKIILPKADKPVTVAREDADSISLTVDGEYFFRDAAAEEQIDDLTVLIERLKQRDDANKDRPVIIRCDARCEYQQFVQVKNALKLAGIETIFEEVEVRHDGTEP